MMVNDRTQLTYMKSLHFGHHTLPPKTVEMTTLEAILSDPIEHQRVNVLVKVMDMREKTETTTRANKILAKTSYAVSEKTSSIMLTVWGNNALNIHNWYTLQNLSVRFFEGKVLLSTTLQTVFIIAEDSGIALPALENDVTDTVGQIAQIEVTSTYFCTRRHKVLNVNPAEVLNKCELCNMFCRTSLLTTYLTCTIHLLDTDQNIHEYTLDNTLLKSLVPFHKQAPNQQEYILQQIMQHNSICITSRGKRAIAASFCQDDQTASTSTQPANLTTNHPDTSPVLSIPNSAESFYDDDLS